MNNLTFMEFQKKIKKNPTVIVPLGSFEQHGPAGYLGADYIVADYLAEKISRLTDVIRLPCLPFGFSAIHSNFAGTISLNAEIYEQVIVSIIQSLKISGVKNIIFINGHGGNKMPLKEELCMEGIYFIEWFDLTGNRFFPDDHKSHAGSEELSLLAYINRDYVTESMVQNMVPSKLKVNWKEIKPIERKAEYLTENGVFFKADQYDPEIGKEIEQYVVEKILEKISCITDCGKAVMSI